MKGQATTIAMMYCVLQLANNGEAFTTPPSSSLSQPKMALDSSLNLVPDQANQLVAAFNANCAEKQALAAASPIQVDKNVDDDGFNSHRQGPIAASKSFLTRVFHMPSSKHPGHQRKEDVVYFPMFGFRFFEGIDTVFPTTTHNSCAMPTKSQKEEEVYGWFSSSCKLDLFSEDVCKNPIGSESVQ
jgi:hypothetical protein